MWSDGMLYPLLHRLERLGHIESSWGESPSGRRRKHYRLSASGRAVFAEQRRQWTVVSRALQHVWPDKHGSLALGDA